MNFQTSYAFALLTIATFFCAVSVYRLSIEVARLRKQLGVFDRRVRDIEERELRRAREESLRACAETPNASTNVE